MINKYLNKFKIEQIEQIKKNYNYIYFFRYNDLNYNEKNFLKKEIKKLKFNFFILKQSLIKYFFTHLKGQGSIIIFYSNTPLNINLIIPKFKKIEFIYLYNNELIFSNLKIKYIENIKQNIPLNFQIKKPLFYFYNILNKIT